MTYKLFLTIHRNKEKINIDKKDICDYFIINRQLQKKKIDCTDEAYKNTVLKLINMINDLDENYYKEESKRKEFINDLESKKQYYIKKLFVQYLYDEKATKSKNNIRAWISTLLLFFKTFFQKSAVKIAVILTDLGAMASLILIINAFLPVGGHSGHLSDMLRHFYFNRFLPTVERFPFIWILTLCLFILVCINCIVLILLLRKIIRKKLNKV